MTCTQQLYRPSGQSCQAEGQFEASGSAYRTVQPTVLCLLAEVGGCQAELWQKLGDHLLPFRNSPWRAIPEPGNRSPRSGITTGEARLPLIDLDISMGGWGGRRRWH